MSISALSKIKLFFDPADAAEGDNIGSYTRAGTDGDLISSTNVGGKEGLDVNVINANIEVTQGTSPWVIGDGGGSITVDATDLDIRDLTHVSDSIKIGDGTDFLAINADGSINVNADISVVNGHEKLEDAAHASGDVGSYVLTVRQDVLSTSTSADGDYQSFKTDSLGRLWTMATIDAAIADDDADAGNPIKVGSRAVSTLSAISAANDRADLISDLYRRIYVNDSANVAMAHFAVNVDDTAGGTQLSATPIASRRNIMIQNLDNKEVYIGLSGVTSANGILLPPYTSMQMDVGPNIDVYALGDAAGADIRIMELG